MELVISVEPIRHGDGLDGVADAALRERIDQQILADAGALVACLEPKTGARRPPQDPVEERVAGLHLGA